LVPQVAKYQPGDEVAGNDEKNVHPNKTTAQVFGEYVKDDDDQNRDSP
jgi:hypothetical protein